MVRPQTLIQLLDLYEFQKEMGVPCKCGTEKRETVYGLYGGYFYTRSKKEGVERYKQVRRLVDECLSPDVSVILKRYCTEFELGGQGDVKGQGPSDQTPDATEEELEMEVYIESHFPRIGSNNSQPRFLIADVIKEWIHFAYQQGDETYKEVTGGKPLFPPYVTYHKERRNRNVIT